MHCAWPGRLVEDSCSCLHCSCSCREGWLAMAWSASLHASGHLRSFVSFFLHCVRPRVLLARWTWTVRANVKARKSQLARLIKLLLQSRRAGSDLGFNLQCMRGRQPCQMIYIFSYPSLPRRSPGNNETTTRHARICNSAYAVDVGLNKHTNKKD